MDWKVLGLSSLVVFALMTVAGTIISLISSQLQCSKIGVLESLKQGSIYASLPTAVYLIVRGIDAVRSPFSNTLASFGISRESAEVLGIGYTVMLAAWITTVWNIHNTEKNVCTPDVQEMTAFKQKLMAELAQKQEAEEKNQSAKTA
jgi:hypothetical protein